MIDFLFEVFGVGEGLGDFVFEDFAIAFAEAVDGDAGGALAHGELPGGLRAIEVRGAGGEGGAEDGEFLGILFFFQLGRGTA